MSDFPPDAIGLAEAARLLPGRLPGRKLSTRCLIRWVLSGKLRGWRIGPRLWAVSRADIISMARQYVPKPQEPVPGPRSRRSMERGKQWAYEILRANGVKV